MIYLYTRRAPMLVKFVKVSAPYAHLETLREEYGDDVELYAAFHGGKEELDVLLAAVEGRRQEDSWYGFMFGAPMKEATIALRSAPAEYWPAGDCWGYVPAKGANR